APQPDPGQAQGCKERPRPEGEAQYCDPESETAENHPEALPPHVAERQGGTQPQDCTDGGGRAEETQTLRPDVEDLAREGGPGAPGRPESGVHEIDGENGQDDGCCPDEAYAVCE